jgi:predicted KAP-like P-loop ATPase
MSPMEKLEHDYLNRWPFAREIFGIVTTGPKDWSVRIGIYGQWGSGKTSVLTFIDRMAAASDQIVVHFNPWQFASTDELWRSFVTVIFREIEKVLGERQHGSRRRSIKKFFTGAATDIPEIIELWRKEAAAAARRFDSAPSHIFF